MRKLLVFVPIGLLALLTMAATGSCEKGLSKKQIRRIVRDEVQEQLRERKRRQAPRTPAMAPPTTAARARPEDPPSTDSKQRRLERLRRRIQTLEALVARFGKSPGVAKDRVAMMKRQLARMRERLARAEGGQPQLNTPPATPPVTSAQTRKDWLDAVAAGIRPLGNQRWQIDRRLLASVLKSPGFASADAKSRLHLVGGKARGFKLIKVRPKGLFWALGLKAGDVIERVNNTPLTDSNKVLTLYKSLSKARLVPVILRRGGRRIVHVYTIK